MRKSRFSVEQITYALKQVETGVPVAEVCRKLGISEQTFCVWKKKYGGMGAVEARRVNQLEDENRRLKQLGIVTCWNIQPQPEWGDNPVGTVRVPLGQAATAIGAGDYNAPCWRTAP